MIRAGDAYWIDPGVVKGHELAKRRPYIVVQAEAFGLSTAICVPTSTSRPLTPLRVEVEIAGQLARACPEHVRALSVEERFNAKNYIDNVGPTVLADIRNKLFSLLGA